MYVNLTYKEIIKPLGHYFNCYFFKYEKLMNSTLKSDLNKICLFEFDFSYI